MRARPCCTVTIYSTETYVRMGKMPPVCAPDSVWAEWRRLRIEAGEISPIDELIEEGAL